MAQTPRGMFLQDSIEIGLPVKYVLTYQYDPALQVLFPDSTHDYSPFELVDKQFFPTVTESGQSRDSVIYTLTSFELEEIQRISMPISIEEAEDAKVVYTAEDSVFMVPMLQDLADSVPLLTNTNMLLIPTEFNYPLVLMVVGILLSVFLLLGLIFGKNIRRHYRLRRLNKKHLGFTEDFEKLISDLHAKDHTEKALLLWKHYSGGLIEQPLASYTTREIKQILPSEELYNSLKTIDRALYAGFDSEQLKDSFNLLKSRATEYYQEKVEEIKNE